MLVWTALAVGAVYWGYRDVMASCPPFDGFAGCFETPYRLAATIAVALWLVVEIPLVFLWLGGRRTRHRHAPEPVRYAR
ncbi:MAG TPA: hypothetical protein VHJ34_09200 [Actinomycetota bacterium]|nr:hypothetical protein [Actinomycetota bacterium]